MTLKKVALIGFGLGCLLTTQATQAAELVQSDNDLAMEEMIEARGLNLQFEFSSYPPKTYKGLKLIHVKKISNNSYIGIYS